MSSETKVYILRDSHKLLVTPYKEFERQFSRENCTSRFEAKKAVNGSLKFKFSVWSQKCCGNLKLRLL
jgi:hypothetical protein